MKNKHAITSWRNAQTPKMTQEEFAGKIGVTKWMVTRMETGHRRPSWGLLSRIREVTSGEVTANDFLEDAQQ